MQVLGIETTCDETGCAVVAEGRRILSNVVSSQVDMHREFGGVVPELACRRHVDILLPVLDQALTDAGCSLRDIELIAVAKGPGLIGPLMIGINAAKALSWTNRIPMIGVNHVEAHLYAAMMSHEGEIEYPCLGAVLSGGHTTLVLVRGIGSYEVVGQTVDDAVGEAFDKVAKILDLPYPGGPVIEALAKEGNPDAYPFKSGRVKKQPLAFSFSGLKTAVLYAVKGQSATYDSPLLIDQKEIPHVAASFQKAALNDVVKKTLLAAEQYECRSIVLGGGVTCNQRLREIFAEKGPTLSYFWPSGGLSLDNAAMIAGLGYHQYRLRGKGDDLAMEATASGGFAI